MAEYIDREAMLEQIARRESLMVSDKMISIDALREFIMNRPIADVEEVKHGHWILTSERLFHDARCVEKMLLPRRFHHTARGAARNARRRIKNEVLYYKLHTLQR